MGAFIERNVLNLTVLGQVQYDYTVDGTPGFPLDMACMASTFKRVASVEDELSAMSAAVKRRAQIMTVYGRVLADTSAAIGYISGLAEDKYMKIGDKKTEGGVYALRNAYNVMVAARLDVSMFGGFNGGSTQIKVSDLRKIREEVKFAADQEANVLQRNNSILQTVLNKRDSAISLVNKLRKRLDKTMATAIRNIGR